MSPAPAPPEGLTAGIRDGRIEIVETYPCPGDNPSPLLGMGSRRLAGGSVRLRDFDGRDLDLIDNPFAEDTLASGAYDLRLETTCDIAERYVGRPFKETKGVSRLYTILGCEAFHGLTVDISQPEEYPASWPPDPLFHRSGQLQADADTIEADGFWPGDWELRLKTTCDIASSSGFYWWDGDRRFDVDPSAYRL